MRTNSSDGMSVVAPDAVAMDESALTRAVHKVFDGGYRDDGLDGLDIHNRSAPNALVVSALALALEGNRTPSGVDAYSRPDVRLFSGFHASKSASIPLLSSG